MADSEHDIEQMAARVADARGFLHIDDKTAELARLDEEIAAPGFWDDAAHAQGVSKQASNLRETIREYDEAAALLDDARAALELAGEDEAFAAEADDALARLSGLLDALEITSWFSERFDGGDAILTVNPGSGGLEAQGLDRHALPHVRALCREEGLEGHDPRRGARRGHRPGQGPPSRSRAATRSAC